MSVRTDVFALPITSQKNVFEEFFPLESQKFIKFSGFKLNINYSKLKTYRDSNEVNHAIRLFQSFAGASKHFKLELAEPYGRIPIMYSSLTKKDYLYKHELFIHLQSLALIGKWGTLENTLIFSMIGFYLKTKENQLNDQFELVPYQEDSMMKLKDKLFARLNSFPESRRTSSISVEEVFEDLKKVLPTNEEDPEYSSVLRALNNFQKERHTDNQVLLDIASWVGTVVEEFDTFMDAHPTLFFSKFANSEVTTPLVRLFVFGKLKFVLAHELLEQMQCGGLDVSKIKEDIENMDQLGTIAFTDVFKLIGGAEMKKIEFVMIPIKVIKHQPIYIPSFDGNYCIRVIDFIMDILVEMILVKSVFQDASNKDIIFKCLNNLIKLLSTDKNGPTLIDIKRAKEIKTSFFAQLPSIEAKDIRPVGSKEFTPTDVQKEMCRLGLLETFPTILNYHVSAYNVVWKSRRAMETCDLNDVLKICQLNCIFDTCPILLKFFHRQGFCHMNPAGCVYCKGIKSIDEDDEETSEASEESTEKKSKRRPKKKRQSQKKTSVEETSEESAEEVKQDDVIEETSTSDESPEEVEDVEQTPSTPEDFTPEAPSNNNCTKCFRTSQHCEAWKEKLREEKIKSKALRKEVSEGEKREMEKDERIRQLEEKLLAQEKEKDEKIRQLEEKLAALEAKESTSESEKESEDEEEEKKQPIRYLAPSYKWCKLSPEGRTKLNEHITARDSISTLQGKATAKAQKLIQQAKDCTNQCMARHELNQILTEFKEYYQVLQKNIEMIRDKGALTSLPEPPKFSESFEKAYNTIVNGELEDKECIICFDEMNDHKDTVKCNGCNRRYHKECAWDWSTKGRDQCPTCTTRLSFD